MSEARGWVPRGGCGGGPGRGGETARAGVVRPRPRGREKDARGGRAVGVRGRTWSFARTAAVDSCTSSGSCDRGRTRREKGSARERGARGANARGDAAARRRRVGGGGEIARDGRRNDVSAPVRAELSGWARTDGSDAECSSGSHRHSSVAVSATLHRERPPIGPRPSFALRGPSRATPARDPRCGASQVLRAVGVLSADPIGHLPTSNPRVVQQDPDERPVKARSSAYWPAARWDLRAIAVSGFSRADWLSRPPMRNVIAPRVARRGRRPGDASRVRPSGRRRASRRGRAPRAPSRPRSRRRARLATPRVFLARRRRRPRASPRDASSRASWTRRRPFLPRSPRPGAAAILRPPRGTRPARGAPLLRRPRGDYRPR